MRRGAAIVTLIDALESRGIRVELWVAEGMSDQGTDSVIAVQVKRPEDTLNLEKVAFQCANSDFLRRMMFAYFENHKDIASFISYYGYGRPLKLHDEKAQPALAQSGLDLDGFDIVFDSNKGEFDKYATPELTRDEITKQLKDMGIEVDLEIGGAD